RLIVPGRAEGMCRAVERGRGRAQPYPDDPVSIRPCHVEQPHAAAPPRWRNRFCESPGTRPPQAFPPREKRGDGKRKIAASASAATRRVHEGRLFTRVTSP